MTRLVVGVWQQRGRPVSKTFGAKTSVCSHYGRASKPDFKR